MDMPKVAECDVQQCAYNRDKQCHALAITVGDDVPRCDTYTSRGGKAGDPGATASVGACKVTLCRFNKSLECSAPAIRVGQGSDDADCLTFEPM